MAGAALGNGAEGVGPISQGQESCSDDSKATAGTLQQEVFSTSGETTGAQQAMPQASACHNEATALTGTEPRMSANKATIFSQTRFARMLHLL